MQRSNTPASPKKTKARRALSAFRSLAARSSPRMIAPTPHRFAAIAMRMSAELRHLSHLGQTFNRISYCELGKFNRIAGASQSLGSELANALSDGVLTQREISQLTRKAMAANGALAPQHTTPRR